MGLLSDITLARPDGTAVRISELVDRPTIVVIPRYYGCLPCRDYLRRLAERHDEIEEAGAAALGVSVGADYQAQWLIETYRIPFPLLVDPERRLYDAIDLPRRWWVGLNPKGWLNYLRAILRGNRQGKVVSANQLPGLVVLDADAEPVWIHRGRALGDYPSLDRVLAKVVGSGAGTAA